MLVLSRGLSGSDYYDKQLRSDVPLDPLTPNSSGAILHANFNELVHECMNLYEEIPSYS